MKRANMTKSFDCLAFKEREQKRLYRETKGMTRREEMEYYHRKALEGPFAYLSRLQKPDRQPVARVGEKPAKYR